MRAQQENVKATVQRHAHGRTDSTQLQVCPGCRCSLVKIKFLNVSERDKQQCYDVLNMHIIVTTSLSNIS